MVVSLKGIDVEGTELPDDADEQVLGRVAAIDVAKKAGKVCIRVPHEQKNGKRRTVVLDVVASYPAVVELADTLVCEGVERVTIESTSDYRRLWYFVLEERGLEVCLVNARDVKNVPGRPKTDKLDAVWLAKLTERGMLRASFVPPKEIRDLRDLTQMSADLIADRTRAKQRVEKVLELALIKLSAVISDLFGVSGRRMLDALAVGERDPRRLADLSRGLKAPRETLIAALTGQFTDHHTFQLTVYLEQIDEIDKKIALLSERIEQYIAALPMPEGRVEVAAPAPTATETSDGEDTPVDPTTGEILASTTPAPPVRPAGMTGTKLIALLDAIPGISVEAARIILAESAPTCPGSPPRATWCRGRS